MQQRKNKSIIIVVSHLITVGQLVYNYHLLIYNQIVQIFGIGTVRYAEGL